jgi:Na+-transporting NADH:ubiquinone oxidoreductase subunit C
MKTEVRIVVFAAILGIVCSILLAGAETLLKPFREANEQAEEMRNYLSALEVPVGDGASASELIEVFEENISVGTLGDLQLYTYTPAGSEDPKAFAIPFSGAGLWGPIFGVLALEPDMVTIRGIRFFKQEETPGLGGEIGADWFQHQFSGKKIVSDGGEYQFEIAKPGSPIAANRVDGITGATMTSDRVETIISTVVSDLEREGPHVQ